MHLLLLALLLTGCSYFEKHEEKDASAPTEVTTLEERFSERKALYEASTSSTSGWASLTDCDGLLWNGLGCAAGLEVDISLAEYGPPGVVQRRPAPACWTASGGDDGSKSSISNDMLLGYIWCGWRAGKLDALQRLADYGEAHNWVMGEPFPEEAARVVLKPNQISLLGQALYALSGGDDNREYRHTPRKYFGGQTDYELHIQTLGIMLGSEISTAAREQGLVDINGEELAILEQNAASYPGDALVQAALGVYTGDMTAAVNLLMSDSYEYPSYVRGAELYKEAHWLFTASLVLRSYRRGE